MTEKSPLRSCDDIDEVVLNYAEIKGLAMKNPFMKEKMQVETEINKINLLKANFMDSKERYKRQIKNLPIRIEKLTKSIENINLDVEIYKTNKPVDFEITLNNIKFNDRTEASEYFMELKSKIEREKDTRNIQEIGSYAGFKIGFTTTMGFSKVYLIGNKTYERDLGVSNLGNITRIENLASGIEEDLFLYENRLEEVSQNLKQAKEEIDKPFEYDERLNYLLKRKIEIDYNIENDITIENEENQEVEENEVTTETTYTENVVIETNIYDEKDMPVDKIRELYPKGTMIMLENMENENLPKGLIGQVKNVDDMGQIHMIWQNGSGLPLNTKVDKFKVLDNEQNINKEPKIQENIEEYGQDWEEI